MTKYSKAKYLKRKCTNTVLWLINFFLKGGMYGLEILKLIYMYIRGEQINRYIVGNEIPVSLLYKEDANKEMGKNRMNSVVLDWHKM